MCNVLKNRGKNCKNFYLKQCSVSFEFAETGLRRQAAGGGARGAHPADGADREARAEVQVVEHAAGLANSREGPHR